MAEKMAEKMVEQKVSIRAEVMVVHSVLRLVDAKAALWAGYLVLLMVAW